MIFMSGMVALMISFVIAIPFARNLAQPITSMRSTALELAAGNYEAETGIVRYDEIGELATTIDFLADKLAENEIERKNLDQILAYYRDCNIRVLSMQITRAATREKHNACVLFSLRLNKNVNPPSLINKMLALEGVISIEEL